MLLCVVSSSQINLVQTSGPVATAGWGAILPYLGQLASLLIPEGLHNFVNGITRQHGKPEKFRKKHDFEDSNMFEAKFQYNVLSTYFLYNMHGSLNAI